MLKSTLSKFKKVLILTLSSGIWRGEINRTSKIGKRSMLIQIKNHNSSSSDKNQCEKCKKIIERIFSPNLPETTKKISHNPVLDVNLVNIKNLCSGTRENKCIPQLNVTEESRCQHCENVIKQIFDPEDSLSENDVLGNAIKISINESYVISKGMDQEHYPIDKIKNDDLESVQKSIPHNKGKIVNAYININEMQKEFMRTSENTNNKEILQSKATTQNKDVDRNMEQINELPIVVTPEPTLQEYKDEDKKLVQNLLLLTRNEKMRKGLQETLDELAERCLDAPPTKIDERLLEEIKKLQSSQGNSATNSGIAQDDTDSPQLNFSIDVKNNLDQTDSKSEPQDKETGIITLELYISTPYCNRQEDVVKTEQETLEIAKDPEMVVGTYGSKNLIHSTEENNNSDMGSQKIGDILESDTNKESNNKEAMALCQSSIAQAISPSSNVINKDDMDKRVVKEPFPSFEVRNEAYNSGDTVVKCESNDEVRDSGAIEKSAYKLQENCSKKIIPVETMIRVHDKTQKDDFNNENDNANSVKDSENVGDIGERRTPGINVGMNTNIATALGPLPELNPEGSVSLSELLKRVRERNRMEYCKEYSLQYFNAATPELKPVEGKTPRCPPPAPKCPPPAPKCPPPCPPPPPPCPPPPPPCPKPCKPVCPPPCPPPKKNPCCKFVNSHNFVWNWNFLILFQFKPRSIISLTNISHEPDNHNSNGPMLEPCGPLTGNLLRSKSESIVRFNWSCRPMITKCSDSIEALNEGRRVLARDFQPWVPIPSWPAPVKEKKTPLVCPKEGCKVLPPPKLGERCPHDTPCLNFPKRQNFSLVDFFIVTLGKNFVSYFCNLFNHSTPTGERIKKSSFII